MRFPLIHLFRTALLVVIFSTFSQAQSSVFGVIQARPDLQKFEEGLISTGLNTTFANKDGVYTIFAPTNDAFSMIPGAILNNQAALKDLILTHCVFGFYRTSDLVDGRDLSTMNLRNLGVNFVGNRIFINGAEMIVRNIQGNNGMVHIIDTVIPKSSTTETTVMSVIRNSTEHIFLSQMVENVEMDDYLATENNITFFAPNDDAFLRLSDEKFQRFFGNDTRYIIDVINFHIVEKIIEFEELTHNAMFTALNGQKLTITIDVPNTITFINNVKIQFAGIRAVNGIVYTIEKIMVPEPLPEITIEDYVRESEFHTTLEIAIDESGLSPILSADGDWTFFAPTDEAFEKMDEATLDLLLNNFPGLLRDLMDNHLVEGRFFLEELKALEVVNAVNGFELIIKEEADGDYINKSKFLINNIEVDNGIVHVLDAVLQTSDSLVTVHDIVTTTDAISTFGEYVRESPLDSLLQTDGPFTVFAPNNTAFSNLPDAFIEILENDTMNLLNSFLENHVINGNFPSSNLTHNLTLTTRFGEEVVITVEPDGRVFVNQGLIIIDNLIADNGVVHVIDAVIDLEEPPLTIYGYVAGSQDLNILESLITNSNLRQLYDSTENLTLFAPTDNAFENLPDDYLNDTDISFIIDLLFRHTLSAETLLSEIITKDWLISSGLDSLRVTIENNEFFIRDAKIIISDIVLANGIVHVVDAVITDNEFIPEPVFTVYDIISESENHTVFKGYIDSASLDAKLREDTTITVFAPTNEAFGILPLGLINALEADPDGLLRETLLYHINKDSLSSNELTDDLVLLMEDGNEAFIDVTTDGIFINDAKLVFENFAASNGVVHFIDAVITPIEPTKTVFDFIAQSSIHKTLESAVIAAELDDELAEQNPITMFAPTDEAFDALPSIVLDALLNNPQGDLLNLLLIHKNDNLIRRADLTDGVELNMTNGEIVKVSVQSDTIYVNNAKVIMEEVIADNGIVHVIDAIILKREERNTIYDFIAESEDHTILKDAIDSSGLDQELIDGVGITYFAPTNDAFNALPADVLNDLLADPNGALLDLLKFHKYNAELFSTDITNELVITMDNGVEVTFTVSSDGIFINNAKLGVTDIEVDNGIVHEIDAIIEEVVERVTVYDFLVNSPDHTLLKEAIDSAGLAVNLMEEESITLFAPTDASIENLPAGFWDELLLDPSGDLRNILLKHVYPDNIVSTGLLNGLQLVMQNGEAVIVTTSGNSIFLDDAEIIMRDIVTDNGIVHVIDAVLVEIIISNTIFDIVANSPDHTILEDLLIQAGLDFALRVNEPITLFAPTDAAFNALSDEVMNELLSDPSGLLRDLLLYHTTNTLIGSSDLSDQLFIIMGTGESSKITINNDGTFINNAKFLVVDIIADNGIVNIIDAVLEPLISGVDNQDLAELKIYPNPVSDVLNIEDSGYYKLISSVSIYDAKGRLIQKVTDNTNNNQIDVSTLESGLYYIIINDHEVLHPFIKH